MIKTFQKKILMTDILKGYLNIISKNLMSISFLYLSTIIVLFITVFLVRTSSNPLLDTCKGFSILLICWYFVYFSDLILYKKKLTFLALIEILVVSTFGFSLGIFVEIGIDFLSSIPLIKSVRLVTYFFLLFCYLYVSYMGLCNRKENIRKSRLVLSNKMNILKVTICSTLFFIIPSLFYIIIRNTFFPTYNGTEPVVFMSRIYIVFAYPLFIEYKNMIDKAGII